MEIIGRRWTITGAFLLSIPGLLPMVMAHRAGSAATIVFSAGALITGFTTLHAGRISGETGPRSLVRRKVPAPCSGFSPDTTASATR
jgi:VIT1/CCC1 family predicted Fe2+/Mn2+ transporter